MVMTVSFVLEGQEYMALNGGPEFPFDRSLSLSVDCEDQEEVDRLWGRLLEGGGVEGQCGWLKDRFGLSWQIIPSALPRLMSDPDPERAQRVMAAMLQMVKIDVAALENRASPGAERRAGSGPAGVVQPGGEEGPLDARCPPAAAPARRPAAPPRRGRSRRSRSASGRREVPVAGQPAVAGQRVHLGEARLGPSATADGATARFSATTGDGQTARSTS